MTEPGRSLTCRIISTSLAALVLGGGLFEGQAEGQAIPQRNPFRGANQAAVPEGAESVFYPPDRATMQRFSTAKELLGEQRFSEASRLLGGILEVQEDYFFQPDRQTPVYRSLKSEARRLIGEMPAAGRESYELQYGAQARRMLADAVSTGDADALAAVSRQFFHTQAGYEATYLLGDSEMSHGRPLAAALCLRRLQETPRAAAPFEPTLSLKIAVCWLRSGMPEQAAAVLVRLKHETPDAEFQINGKPRKLFGSDSQALAWLSEIVGDTGRSESDLGLDQWTMYRGAPTRNSASPGSSPLLNRRWATPTANDPQLEKQLAEMREQHLEQGGRLTPCLHPLAVNDFVFMRSVNCLEAIDFRTGKRIWNGPLDEHVDEMLRQSAAVAAGGGNGAPNWLEQRVWDDAIYGTLSSDGARVYCVEDLAGNMQETVPGVGMGGRRMMVVNNGRVVTPNTIFYNRLAAYEIATEGKLNWQLGGEPQEDGLRLAGAFFLGPPLPLGGRLYVLAEMKGEIRLLALEAETGAVVWSQQIAVVERSILEDPLRRIAGASPSYSDGVLVCPTSAGAVVAVDLTTRALLWGYQYPRAVDPSYQNRMFQFRFGGLPVNDLNENDRWADASVTIAEGRVLLTPLESPQIHCLNLIDGKLQWQEPRGGGIYVACVHDGKVLVVNNRDLRALKLADGQPAWKTPAALPSGSMPSGRGFFDGQRYFLPLTSAEVAAIDAATGEIVGRSRSRTGDVPGNLICYRGAVISQGIDRVECFYQLEDLRKQVAAALKEHPDDPQATARQGELLLDEGKLDEAVDALRRSFELQADPRTRELLVDALLEGLRVDFARRRQNAAEVERLAELPAERARFQRLMAIGLQQSGESLAAFEAYLRMVDLKNPLDELERVEQALSVRRDRWVRARLAGLLESASEADRETMRGRLHSILEEVRTDGAPDGLRAFVSFFGAFPESDEAREALAVRLLGGDSPLEAEQLLRRLALSSEAARAQAATARLAQLLLKGERYADAARYCRTLQNQWADVACLDGKTGRQWVEEMSATPELLRQISGPAVWPEGEVEKHADPSPALATYRNLSIEFRGPLGPYFEHMTLESDQQQGALVGRDSLGREAWRVALHDRGGFNPMGFNQAINHVRVDGHFLLASLGYQLVAIDTLGPPGKGGPRVLWRQDLGDGSGFTRQATIRNVNMPWGVPRMQAIDLHGRPIGNTGPIGDDFVCYQRLRNLTVVQPLSGETLWVRNDVPAGSEIFGDESLLFVVPPNAHEAIVYRTTDGQEMGRRALPPFEQRVLNVGRLVLAWNLGDARGKATLKLFDPWEQQELWRRQFRADARFACLGEEAIGVLERSGKFALLSISSGEPQIEAQVTPEPSLEKIYLIRSATRDMLVTNRPFQHRNNNFTVVAPPSPGGEVVDGMIHGFDRQTGKKVYSTRLELKGLSTSQPYDSPILTFAANIQSHMRNNQTPHGNVMCLDKRNGRVIYEEDLTGPIGSVDVACDVDKHEVTVRTMKSSKRLVFTDRPVAPPPEEKKDQPKTTDSTSLKAGRAVLRGVLKWAADLAETAPMEPPARDVKPAASK